jgi:hypothetical protein
MTGAQDRDPAPLQGITEPYSDLTEISGPKHNLLKIFSALGLASRQEVTKPDVVH